MVKSSGDLQAGSTPRGLSVPGTKEKLMRERSRIQKAAWACALTSLCASLAAPLWAIEPAAGANPAAGTVDVSLPIFEVEPSLADVRAQERPELGAFFGRWSSQWEVRWDRRADRPNLIQGRGVPLLPGKGNQLEGDAKRQRTVDEVAQAVQGFLAQEGSLLGAAGLDLRLDRSRSVPFGADQYLWTIELQQFHQGVPVDDAHLYFRINHGNLVQFGNHRVVPVQLDATPAVKADEAFRSGLDAAGVTARVGEKLDRGTLKIFPVLDENEAIGEAFAGAAGQGYRHLLAWEFQYRLAGDAHLYRLRVDAKTGRPLQLVDLTDVATVTANIYPTTNTDPLVNVGLPFTNVTNGTAKVTDAAGVYTYGSGTATATLNGKYFKMSDACGAISLSDSATGNLAFGGAGGTDCTTPGVGGAGNTHSSRTGFYHLTKINRKAASFFPSNTWLASTVTANMNINNTCNAFWNGTTVNFYRSGGGCSNTGEIAAVFLHEWGHGMDTNSGGAASDKGSGEAVGDTFAFLETKNSCIGQNFQPGVNCANCSSCTGVRDLDAFALGGSATIAKPSTVTDNAGINCDRYSCPYNVLFISPYQGPMGYEGHCESYIASTANWDLAQSLVSKYGSTAGWAAADKIWYGSLTPSKSAYQLVSGGKCNAAAVVNGCGSANWYTVYLPADDDDGNLANGTPNACRIWDAFNAHGIACGTRPTCTVP